MMKSGVLPGAGPTPFLPASPPLTLDTRKRCEQSDVKSGRDEKGIQPPDKYFKKSSPDTDMNSGKYFKKSLPDTDINSGKYFKKGLPDTDKNSDKYFKSSSNASMSSDNYFKKSSPDTDRSPGFLCPSTFPYLLTLRGHDIHKDLLLYPLKSPSLTIGRNLNRSHGDDINLLAEDIQQLHCHLNLKTLPVDNVPADGRRYCYCLLLEVQGRAMVYLNGVRVENSATVHPGDVLGVGHHYLFLYKDPTCGHDIPDTLPWYPDPSCQYAQVNKRDARKEDKERDSVEQHVLKARVSSDNQDHEYSELDHTGDRDSFENHGEITVPYAREREEEVMEYIANISCCSPAHFPLTTTVLLMGCHNYASRHFPPSHQAGFFSRLLTTIRNRVSRVPDDTVTFRMIQNIAQIETDNGYTNNEAVSKTLSALKYQTHLFTPGRDNVTDDSPDGGDPLLELFCWLSNTVRIYNHVSSADFRSRLVVLQCGSDVTESLQGLCEGLEETINFTFQQTVYCITKVLFAAVVQILEPSISPSAHADSARAVQAMERVLHVLHVTFDVSEDVSLHHDVTIQLLMYLIFFVTTTLFNRLITKGGTAHQLCWSMGVRLQSCVSSLENWVSSAGLEAQYLRVSESLVSLVDLLATSTRTLLKMDWSSLKSQYSPLSDGQLARVLSGYRFDDGQSPPPAWSPPSGLQLSDNVSISLAAHPPFVLPRHGSWVDLKVTFPPPLYSVLHDVTSRFSHSAEHGSQRQSSNTVQRPAHLILPAPCPSPFFSTISPPTSTLPFNFTPHTPSQPPTQHKMDTGQDVQSPPLPQRYRGQRNDSPPPLPPRQRSATSVVQKTDKEVSKSGENIVSSPSGLLQRSGGGNSKEPAFGALRDSCVNNSASDKTVLGVSFPEQTGGRRDRDDHIKDSESEESVTKIRVTQSTRTLPTFIVSSEDNYNKENNRPHRPPQLFQPQAVLDHSTSQPSHSSPTRGPPPYHTSQKHSVPQSPPKQRQPQDFRVLPELKPRDPRRRPLNGAILTSGPLTLQEKRVLNEVPLLDIPSETMSLTSDSAVSDDVFVHSSAELPQTTHLGSSVQATEFRRFSTGMLSQTTSDTDTDDRPRVLKVDMRELDTDHVTVDPYPDDTYIDVAKELSACRGGGGGGLRVLPHEDDVISKTLVKGGEYGEDKESHVHEAVPRIQYRHSMPQNRDCSTKGEITGEVFTLTLIKQGARLGMGLIDGMYTPLKLPGIYVRNVLAGTPAALCGHIRVGDRILAVNGRSIVGSDYNSAMKLIRSSGPRLNLLVAKCDRSVTASISAS